jgi:hypothetical protein
MLFLDVETRRPKPEGRKKSEIRIPKSKLVHQFGFRASAFFRVSDLGLRILGFVHFLSSP